MKPQRGAKCVIFNTIIGDCQLFAKCEDELPIICQLLCLAKGGRMAYLCYNLIMYKKETTTNEKDFHNDCLYFEFVGNGTE